MITKNLDDIKLTSNLTWTATGNPEDDPWYCSNATLAAVLRDFNFNEIPPDAEIISATISKNAPTAHGTYSFAIYNGNTRYADANDANFLAYLREGYRTGAIRATFRAGYGYTSQYKSPTSVTATYTDIILTVDFEAGGNTYRVAYGTKDGWVVCECYYGVGGKWQPCQAFYGQNGEWKPTNHK
ncbi:MAG: hypothetical protein MJZ55_00205 [Paludibacteraceae bacterium]|nr:hypothetical protein [Paludibacteraceae bacterium]